MNKVVEDFQNVYLHINWYLLIMTLHNYMTESFRC